MVNIAEVNGTTYAATAYVYYDGEEHFLEKLLKSFQQTNNTGNLGLFLAVLLTIVFGFVGYGLAGAAGTLIAVPLPLLFTSLFGMIAIDKGIMIFVELISVILAIYINRRD